jgi:hypothetical protein
MLYLLRLLLLRASAPQGEKQVGTVVWGYHGAFYRFDKQPEGKWSVRKSAVCPEFDLAQPAVLLFDVCKGEVREDSAPFFAFRSCVFSSSPDPQQYQHAVKALRPIKYVMEPWECAELEDVAPAFGLTPEVVNDRACVVGPVPRLVLGSLKEFEDAKFGVTGAIKQAVDKRLLSYCILPEASDKAKVFTQLFAMRASSDGDGTPYRLTVLSRHIEDELVNAYRDAIIRGVFERGTLGGILFEHIVCEYLRGNRDLFPNAQYYEWREQSNQKWDWTQRKSGLNLLPPVRANARMVVVDHAHLRPMADFPDKVNEEKGECVLVAPQPNYPLIDFVVQWRKAPDGLLERLVVQATVGRDHEVGILKEFGDLPYLFVTGHERVRPSGRKGRGDTTTPTPESSVFPSKLYLLVLAPEQQ